MNKIIPSKKWVISGTLTTLLMAGGSTVFAANDTLALQNALYGAGYSIDRADGQMGPSTRSALEAFQKDHSDLKSTGQLDEATKEALGMVSVKVAAAPASSRKAASSKPAVSEQAKADPQPAEAESEDGVEEEDDGSWLFF
ncbi:peptidoglycan-binding domain-containing protein [Marinobacter fonticola]|uniref:peptidoglycan-binding domain-containing protein n=1 Tax=Marinobacter fonticola TaxID=2603215 RepID=UPI0011E87427|nr:peptidoglycan-binding domain-containing protein [Marinobacter fonticola]